MGYPAGAGAQTVPPSLAPLCPQLLSCRRRQEGESTELTLFPGELEEFGCCPASALTLSRLFPVEVDPELEPESAEYLVALEQATAALEQCVNLCKAHVMMVTCFDIGVAATTAVPGPQEVDV